MAEGSDGASAILDDNQVPSASNVEAALTARARSFGERFVSQRERLGFTLQQVSTCTKVHPRFLKAIEQSDFSRLPCEFLAKSFIRAYAQSIGLNESEVITEYVELTGRAQSDHSSGDERETGPKAGSSHRLPLQNRHVLLITVLVASAVLFLATRHVQRRNGSSGGAQGLCVEQVPSTEVTKVSPEISRAPSRILYPTYPPQGRVSQFIEAPTEQSPQASVCTTGAFCILIKARQDAWMSINVDGKVIMKDTLVAPAQKWVAAQRHVIIRAGNIGALDFSFNGTQLPSQGNYDEARTLSFSTQGLERDLAPNSAILQTSEPTPETH